MDEREWLAARFEEHRPHLRAVAYRMLGSLTDADDALQDAWVRVSRAGASEVENLGGTLTAGGVIVQASDDLYAGELSLPEKAPPRRIVLQPAMKAWQRSLEPRCLLLVARDVSGRTWDCVDGNKPIKDPRKWLAGQLKDLRLQGVVDFPGLTGPAR